VREPDRGRDVGAGRQREAVAAQFAREPAAGQRHHRPQTQRLGDHRAQVALVAVLAQLPDEALECRGSVQQEVKGPGERGRRRFVAGEQQGEELVTQLAIAHLAAVLESRSEQQRQDVTRADR